MKINIFNLKLSFSLIFVLVLLLFSAKISAQTSDPNPDQTISNFKFEQDVTDLDLTVPTVVEIPVTTSVLSNFGVFEVDTATFQPFTISAIPQSTSFIVSDSRDFENYEINLFDNDYSTYREFPVENLQDNSVQLYFKFDQPITTSQLFFSLAENVQLPSTVSIESLYPVRKIIVMEKSVHSGTIFFPQVTASEFTVTFFYTQPLRITEIKFNEIQFKNSYFLRFLAQPNNTYRLFSGKSPGLADYPVGEAGNLDNPDIKVKRIEAPILESNLNFHPPDRDGDKIPDDQDNCLSIANTDQTDANYNSTGDACEDFDLDGIMNLKDNCPNTPNRLQQDTDADGIGDHCDSEESRIFERLWFLPWIGIVLGFGVVMLLFKTTIKAEKK